MSKTVLVIDTPDDCRSCNFFGGSYHLKFCCANRRYIEDSSKRSSLCPLKSLPEKLTYENSYRTTNDDYRYGWNDCIDEITTEVI